MPSWKKVVVSGSSPTLNELTTSGDVTAGGTLTISDGTPTLNFYDTDDSVIRGFIQWDGTAGSIDSDSTLTLRANNTSGARIEWFYCLCTT